jgi:Plant mobile domain
MYDKLIIKLKLQRDSNIIHFCTMISYISHIQDRLRGLRFLHLTRLQEIHVQEMDACNLMIDTGLLSALIEFWRPITHTFHFNFGEMIVTLKVSSQILFLILLQC